MRGFGVVWTIRKQGDEVFLGGLDTPNKTSRPPPRGQSESGTDKPQMPQWKSESCNDKPPMPLSLALSVTTGSRVTSGRASPPIEKGVPRHGGRRRRRPIPKLSTFRIGSPRNNPVFQGKEGVQREKTAWFSSFGPGSKGKGGSRRKTVAFSSFGMGSERRDKKPQVFRLWSWFGKKKPRLARQQTAGFPNNPSQARSARSNQPS